MKEAGFVAIDVGSEVVRLAVVGRNDAGGLVFGNILSGAFEHPVSGEMAFEAMVATTLKRLLDQIDVNVRKAILSVDGQSVFSRLVQLPPVTLEKRAITIRHEAVQNIPFPLENVVWDSHVIDPESVQPEVLLAAVKADLVGGLVDAVAANGLLVTQVAVAPAVLADRIRFAFPDSDECLLFIDAGDVSTNLIFLDGNRTFFRTLPIAAEQLSRLMPEIEQSISFYRNRQGGRAVQRIFISDHSFSMDYVSQRFGVLVEWFDPFHGFEVCADSVDLKGGAVLTGLAVGQIVNPSVSINLIPPALRAQQDRRLRLPLWFAIAVLVVLLGGIWGWGITSFSNQVRQELGVVSAQVRSLRGVERQLIPLEERIDELNGNALVYQNAVNRRFFWRSVFMEVGRNLPEGMFMVSSEPLAENGLIAGMRVSFVSYIDKETSGMDAVKLLRDSLRASKMFGEQSRVHSRPSKRKFARQFVLDLYFDGEQL